MRSKGFTLIELLIVLAIILFLGLVAFWVWSGAQGVVGSGGSGGGLRPGPKQFSWIAAPASFQVGVDTTFQFRVESFNSASQTWQSMGEQETLIGAVTPASVQIVSINGAPPPSADVFPPGVGATGSAYKVSSNDQGIVTFVLRGSEETAGALHVVMVLAANDITHQEKTFEVFPPP